LQKDAPKRAVQELRAVQVIDLQCQGDTKKDARKNRAYDKLIAHRKTHGVENDLKNHQIDGINRHI
jgi:hypothetical protein